MSYIPDPDDQFDIWQRRPTDTSKIPSSGAREAKSGRTPYAATFDGSEANRTAHCIGRWRSTRNEPGPLSETVSATVPG